MDDCLNPELSNAQEKAFELHKQCPFLQPRKRAQRREVRALRSRLQSFGHACVFLPDLTQKRIPVFPGEMLAALPSIILDALAEVEM